MEYVEYGPLGNGFAVIHSDQHGVLEVDTSFDTSQQSKDAALRMGRTIGTSGVAVVVRHFSAAATVLRMAGGGEIKGANRPIPAPLFGGF